MTSRTGPTPSSRQPVAATAQDGLEQRLRHDLDGDVAFDDYTRHLFSRDASMYAITPRGVVFPRHTGDIEAAVAAAAEYDVPLLARGAGTSLAGQTVGPGLVLDLSRHMNRILELDPEAGTALVESGVVQDELNRAAAPHGLMFGPDTSTSSRATIGGMIGNNSAGSGSLRYGMTIDHVRALDVTLSDASTVRLEPVDETERARRAELPTLEGRLRTGSFRSSSGPTPPQSPRGSPGSGAAPAATASTASPGRRCRSTWPSSSSARRGPSPSPPGPSSIWFRSPVTP